MTSIRFADILDITVIAFCVYFLLLWLRRKASRSIVIGIGLVAGLYLLANVLDMYLTSMFFQAGLTAMLVALVLVFQFDIRRAFERLAARRIFVARYRHTASSYSTDILVKAISLLSENKIGALIVVKGKEALDRHVDGGFTLDGRISVPLLHSIFHPLSSGHDGAVVIEGERIERFGVHLPLSNNFEAIGETGTRHSAGLGLAERTDALIIVVSEERGTISIAEPERLAVIRSPIELKERLEAFYRDIFPPPHSGASRFITHHLGLKAGSLATACLLWMLLANSEGTVYRTFSVPIEYRNLPSGWVLDDPKPAEARVSLSGPERVFNFDPSTMIVSLDMSKVGEGSHESVITEQSIVRPVGLQVKQILPNTVVIRAQKMVAADLPVRPRLEGILPPGLKLGAVRCEPDTVAVMLSGRPETRIGEIRTEPISLAGLRQTTTVRSKLVLPRYSQLAQPGVAIVRVNIEIIKREKAAGE